MMTGEMQTFKSQPPFNRVQTLNVDVSRRSDSRRFVVVSLPTRQSDVFASRPASSALSLTSATFPTSATSRRAILFGVVLYLDVVRCRSRHGQPLPLRLSLADRPLRRTTIDDVVVVLAEVIEGLDGHPTAATGTGRLEDRQTAAEDGDEEDEGQDGDHDDHDDVHERLVEYVDEMTDIDSNVADINLFTYNKLYIYLFIYI